MSAPELDLDAIEERASIATPGPWRAAEKADRGRLGTIEIIGGIPCSYVAEIERIGADNQEDRDRDFIIAARADVPALVRLCRAERAYRVAKERHARHMGAWEHDALVVAECDLRAAGGKP